MLELTAHRLDLRLNMLFETLTAPCCKFRWSFRSDGMNIVDANIKGVIFLHLIDGSLGEYLILFLGSPLVMWHLKRWGEYISSGSRVQTRGTLWVAFDLIRYVPDEDLVLRPLSMCAWIIWQGLLWLIHAQSPTVCSQVLISFLSRTHDSLKLACRNASGTLSRLDKERADLWLGLQDLEIKINNTSCWNGAQETDEYLWSRKGKDMKWLWIKHPMLVNRQLTDSFHH